MTRKRNFIKQTEGAAAVIIALSLFALMGAASLAIDVGHLYTVRNQLQNVADAAALGGAGQLITSVSGVAQWNSTQATAAALQVAQSQAVLDGLPAQANGARNDLTIHFGVWNLYAGNPSTAWTDLGTSVGSISTANAVKVTITRAAGTVFGPVTSLFANVLGISSSQISATATAYLGYTNEVQTGEVQVPLALPSTGASSPLAANGRTGWFARLLGPEEAVASSPKTIIFKDTGGSTVTVNSSKVIPTSPVANLDQNQGYFYTHNSSDTVPDTITNTLAKIYTPSLTGSGNTQVLMGDLKVNQGQQVYPRSEYPWGRTYIGAIFQNLQKAYYYKTTGSATKAPAAGTAWQTTLAVHGLLSTASLPQKTGFMSLARLLVPFWASEALACSTITYPAIQVKTVANVNITGVTYNNSTSDDGSYTYPKTMKDTYTGNTSVTYTDQKDFLTRYPNSTWNDNTVTIQVVTNASTVSGPGSLSGGPSNNQINSSAPTNVGAYGTVPRLVH